MWMQESRRCVWDCDGKQRGVLQVRHLRQNVDCIVRQTTSRLAICKFPRHRATVCPAHLSVLQHTKEQHTLHAQLQMVAKEGLDCASPRAPSCDATTINHCRQSWQQQQQQLPRHRHLRRRRRRRRMRHGNPSRSRRLAALILPT